MPRSIKPLICDIYYFQPKGRGGSAAATPVGVGVDEDGHPDIGRRIKVRWADDKGGTRFYEAIVIDYREDTVRFRYKGSS